MVTQGRIIMFQAIIYDDISEFRFINPIVTQKYKITNVDTFQIKIFLRQKQSFIFLALRNF